VSENRDGDAELDAFLARGTDLQRRWREETHEEPPASLDASLRAAARRAASGPAASHPGFAARWRVPLSIAALVVISTTVTLMVADRRAHVPDAGMVSPSPPAPAAPSAELTPAGVPEAKQEARSEPAQVPAPQRSAPAEQRLTESKARAPEPAPGSAEAPAPRADALNDLAKARRAPDAEVQAEAASRERDAIKDERAPPALRTQPPAPAYEPPAGEPSGSSDAMRVRQAPPPAAVAPAKSMQHKADAPATGMAPSGAGSVAPEAQERGEPTAGTLPAEEGELSLRDDPQRWIERIRALRTAGRVQQAEDSLREFRKRYPDYRLPDDLQPPH
jgi:hypothetical protein